MNADNKKAGRIETIPYKAIPIYIFIISDIVPLYPKTEQITILYKTNPSITDNAPLTRAEINFDIIYNVELILVIVKRIFPLKRSAQNTVTNGIADRTGKKMVIYGLIDVNNISLPEN